MAVGDLFKRRKADKKPEPRPCDVTDKVVYVTAGDAAAECERRRDANGRVFKPYTCTHCNQYHLTALK